MTTPSPRPAALVTDAMAVVACEVFAPGISITDQRCIDMMRDAIEAALRTAANHGLVLIPRAELEEAADKLDEARCNEIYDQDPEYIAFANRLRQRSRG